MSRSFFIIKLLFPASAAITGFELFSPSLNKEMDQYELQPNEMPFYIFTVQVSEASPSATSLRDLPLPLSNR